LAGGENKENLFRKFKEKKRMENILIVKGDEAKIERRAGVRDNKGGRS